MSRLATLADMQQAYSDLFKSVHGFRPRWEIYSTIEEYGEAITSLLEEQEEQERTDAFWRLFEEEEGVYHARMGLDGDIPPTKWEQLAGPQLEAL